MNGLRREKIWDPVTRIWHWILVIVVITGWSFGQFMSFSTIAWHFYCGYAVLGLLAFRLAWGLFGPAPARLRALFFRPSEIVSYARNFWRREPSGSAGHNPLGALSVILILLLLLAQASSGLFIESDDYFESAPLAHLVSSDINDRLNWWHKTLAKGVLGIVCLHVAAVFFYLLWKKENLILPMLSGWKWVRRDDASD